MFAYPSLYLYFLEIKRESVIPKGSGKGRRKKLLLRPVVPKVMSYDPSPWETLLYPL